MAFPQNTVSVQPIEALFLAPDTADFALDYSLENGGATIGDGSQGRQIATWRASISGDATAVNIARLDGQGVTTAFVVGAIGITEVALAFDSNMNPAVAYRESGIVKFKWYDSIPQQFITTVYADLTSFKLSADDKRVQQTAVSDVIFAYVRADVLYWCQQRDRYLVEYIAGPALKQRIRRFGMTEINRVQFELERVT